MPAVDLTQLIHFSVERNIGIPAILDAYSEFVDSPIGTLELRDIESVFAAILGNLSERFPQIASKKAAVNARNDIVSFLDAANNNPDRVKTVLRNELRSANRVMSASISERFSRMNTDERKAIDAALRLIRRSQEEIIFRVDMGKGIENGGAEFEKFFAAVKAESPAMKELRFQNLIVEKGIFNKLILKSKDRPVNTIWVPSFFAKENADPLIEKAGVASEHLLLARLRELKAQKSLNSMISILERFVQNQGALTTPIDLPGEISDYVTKIGTRYVVMTPLELDDVSAFLEEEEREETRFREAEEEKQRQLQNLEKSRLDQLELERRRQMQERKRPTIQIQAEEERQRVRSGESIYVGQSLDIDQFVSAINKRASEKEIGAQVKVTGDYFVDLSEIKQTGISIVGSSGSGRSTTLRRILDGFALNSISSLPSRIYVIDQKGEHRGIAWKYKWDVLAFAQDVQSRQIRLPSFLSREDEEGGSELAAGLLQEWLLEAGISCTEQQRARIASIVRAQMGVVHSAETILKGIMAEPELSQIAPKLARNFLSKSAMSRIFTEDLQAKLDIGEGENRKNVIFDVSGRGLRDPTTREERLIASILILKYLLDSNVQFSIIVLEDVLDRFKSESLRKKVIHYVSRLREKENTIVATSRSQIRDFMGGSSLEILHRLSGEKVVNEEISGFKMTHQIKNLAVIVTFLPRGYALTSSIAGSAQGKKVPSAAIRVEPLQFSMSA